MQFGHCPCLPPSVANFPVHICCKGEDFGYSDHIPFAHRRDRAGRAPGSFSWCRAGGGDAPMEAADPLPCLVYKSRLHNASTLNSATVCLTASATPASLQSQQIAPENGYPQPCTDSVSPVSTSRAMLWGFSATSFFPKREIPLSKEVCYFGTVLFSFKVDHVLCLILVDKKETLLVFGRGGGEVWEDLRSSVSEELPLRKSFLLWKTSHLETEIHEASAQEKWTCWTWATDDL